MMSQTKKARYMSCRNPHLRRKILSWGSVFIAVFMLIVTGILPRAWWGNYAVDSANAMPISAEKFPLEPSQEENSSPLSVELTMPHGAIVKPDAPLDLTATFTNSSRSPIFLTSATISSSRSILSTSSALYSWLAGELNGRIIADLSSQLPKQIAPHKSVSISFSVTAQEREWSTAAFSWGSRGLSIDVHASDTEHGSLLATAADHTVAVSVPDTELSRFPIAAAVTCQTSLEQLTDTPSPFESLLETDDSDPVKTSSAQKVNVISSDWDKPGINLFLDPMSLISEPSTSVSASASSVTSTLPQLSSASLYALPAYNSDLSALAQAGANDLLESIRSMSSDARESTPAFSENLYAPVGTEDPETLAHSQRSDTGADKPVIPILPSRALSYGDSFYFPDASGTVELHTGEQDSQIQAIMSNSVLSSILEGTLTLEYSHDALHLSPADIAPTALAYSAILYNQAPSYTRSTVATVHTNCADIETSASKNQSATDTNNIASANPTNANLSSLLSAPWLTPSSLENLPAAHIPHNESSVWGIKADDGAEQAPEDQTDSLSTRTSRSLSAEQIAQIQQFLSEQKTLAAALQDESDFSSRAQHYAYQLLNRDWQADTAERDRRVVALDISSFLRKHIYIQESSHITIIAESSNLPLRIHSDLHVPVTVIPQLDIPDSRLTAADPSSVTLQPNATTTVSIPVTAQGSGYISPHASLHIPNSSGSIASQQLQIRLHAGWETTGVALSAGAIGIVLIIGIIRSVRAGRRSAPISNEQFTLGLHRANTHAHSE